MFRVIKNEITGQYSVWKLIGDTWRKMSSDYYAESNAISLMKVMAEILN